MNTPLKAPELHCPRCDLEEPRDGSHLLRAIPRFPMATIAIAALMMCTGFGCYLLGASYSPLAVPPLAVIGIVFAVVMSFIMGGACTNIDARMVIKRHLAEYKKFSDEVDKIDTTLKG